MVETVRTGPGDVTDEQREAQEKLWPNFTVCCNRCSGFNITLDNSMGFSAESGGWGSIDMICEDCKTSTEIVSS